ncbi:hypothetical protein [Streptomyces sp. SID3343]|uniref:hypothetical protein n=1 Tax=Streptomyces sp. SID3343 TaxID=2690260 RepID=UPI00136A08F1|nr:hypothetical protein [Streptomyces sp. SID3343]MYW03063.1 hypothetical protein [Streptomyces sp. SID3343]
MRALNTCTVTTLAAGLLYVASPGAVAVDNRGGSAITPTAPPAPVAQLAPTITVLRVGTFKPDSVLEVDRSINADTGDGGVVGSDLEGGPGD